MEPALLKRLLRREARDAILAMEAADRDRQQAALDRIFPTIPGFAGAKTVLLYVSAFAEEVETGGMIRSAIELGKRVILPRVETGGDRLALHRVDNLDRDLVPGLKGIPEPRREGTEIPAEAIDWVLVPGLAFGRRGERLGRGRGHYDRLLTLLRPEIPRWALAFDVQIRDAIPVEAHDQRLDGIASPGRGLRRTRRKIAEFPGSAH